MALVDLRVWERLQQLKERYGDPLRVHPVLLPEHTTLPAMMFRVATQRSDDGFDFSQAPAVWRYEFVCYDREWSGVVDAGNDLVTAMSPITDRLDSIEDVYIDAGEGAYARIIHLWLRG